MKKRRGGGEKLLTKEMEMPLQFLSVKYWASTRPGLTWYSLFSDSLLFSLFLLPSLSFSFSLPPSPPPHSLSCLATAQVHLYSLVSGMRINSFSSCSSFWLFVPITIIPHLSIKLHFVIHYPMSFNDLGPSAFDCNARWFVVPAKAIMCRFETLLTGLWRGLLVYITRSSRVW